MDYTNEQLKAAYALNLCTVSVSQIIDYDDINVMEQEYEAILNNLNLEQMPKDEALLKILKQILDTITFFRIQEGDKKFIEKEYQQKMKNAIWSAVPNIGLLVAGGSPVTMAVSLASQIGIGYMNYRKSKAEIELEDERQRWQLEQTAIEQFNGLRRELFDTAWRLSAEYNFPDKLRLTERQIKQYNNILMDGDLIRKYSRMDTIKDSFIAYPPFWYYFGNTANAIARSDMNLSDSTRAFYREKAKEYFIEYRHSNQQGLLREDTVSSSCALELVDLLDIETDKELIKDLLNEAIDYSGRENDVLQLAAVTYLKLNDREKAAELLSQLVNEEYNTVLNAQLLSSVYVSSYLKEPSEYVLGKYEILRNQVGESYLYPMPDNMDKELNDVEWEFVSAQKRVLREKYLLAIKSFVRKYTIRFIKIIPEYGEEKYSDMYLLGDPSAVGDRKYNMSKVFSNSRKAEEYKEMLREVGIDYAILDLLNDMFDSCCVLDVMSESIQEKLARDIETAILNNKSVLIELKNRLDDNSFDLFDMEKLLGVSFFDFTKDFFQDLMSEIGYYINSRNEMQDFAIAEQNLSEFCAKEEIPDPVVLFGKDGDNPEENEPVKEKRFSARLISSKNSESTDERFNASIMVDLIQKSMIKVVPIEDGVEFYMIGDPRIERYFRDNEKLKKDGRLMGDTLAILDDRTQKGDFDLLFTIEGIVPVKNGSVKSIVDYEDVKWATGKNRYLIIGSKFEAVGVDCEELFALTQQLKDYAKKPEVSPFFKLPEIKLSEIKKPFGKK